VQIPAGSTLLEGDLALVPDARGIVVFAHGSGSGRHSPRNRFVANELQNAHLATLLFDLLTTDEEAVDADTGHLRFNIDFLADRLVHATRWLATIAETERLPVGYFGASTGAAAALVAAAQMVTNIRAIVSRGGRPDLAGSALNYVKAPTLLIVGGNDVPVIKLNQMAFNELNMPEKQLAIVPGATHLFEEPGALEEVSALAAHWFTQYL